MVKEFSDVAKNVQVLLKDVKEWLQDVGDEVARAEDGAEFSDWVSTYLRTLESITNDTAELLNTAAKSVLATGTTVAAGDKLIERLIPSLTPIPNQFPDPPHPPPPPETQAA